MADTQHLIGEATAGKESLPCLWLRGIPPHSLTVVDPIHAPCVHLNIKYVNTPNPPSTSWVSGTYYGDASGGAHADHPTIRRIGCGLAKINSDGTLLFGARFNLPGPAQSVPRGELFCVVVLVGLVCKGACIDYVTDNEALFLAYNKGPEYCTKSTNCDLYKTLFDVIKNNNLSVTIRWMPSHLLEKPTKGVFSCMSNLDILGNDHADKLASDAAATAQVDCRVAVKHKQSVALVKYIQLRLATILTHLPSRSTPKRPKVCPAVPLDEILSSTLHVIKLIKSRYHCSKCLQSFHSKDTSLKAWLQTTCFTASHLSDKPYSITYPIHKGNAVTHSTHKLKIFNGLIYCSKCGSRDSWKGLVALAKPCNPPARHGAVSLAALREGRLPPNVQSWPTQKENRQTT